MVVEEERVGWSRPQRRSWWREHVVTQGQSGLSGVEYCRAQGLRPRDLYRWRRVLRASGELDAAADVRGHGQPLFAEVVVQAAAGEAALEVVLGRHRRVRVHPGFDEATLARVVAVLERVSC